jgi:hypothetical protein
MGDAVLNVGGDGERLRREVALAAHAASRAGPVVPPLGEPVQLDRFVVSAWPYRASDPIPATDHVAAQALAGLHASLADTREALPKLTDRLEEVHALLEDPTRTAALEREGRQALLTALAALRGDVGSIDVVLHAEPHDGNRLTSGGSAVYVDFEAVCRGPLEWDVATSTRTPRSWSGQTMIGGSAVGCASPSAPAFPPTAGDTSPPDQATMRCGGMPSTISRR